jgi:hypothetical protein
LSIIRLGIVFHTGSRRNPAARGLHSKQETTMNRADLTEKILDVKREKGWTWKHICAEIGGFSPMLITEALLGQRRQALR